MTAAQPAAGWYPDPSGGHGQRYWDGQQWGASSPVPPPVSPPALSASGYSAPPVRLRPGLKRMAERMARRAGLNEEGWAVAFSYSSGWAALWFAVIERVVEDIPFADLLVTIISFHWHRIILVTNQRTYLLRARMFHQPGELLGVYQHGRGSMTRVRGKLTFVDGQVAYHLPIFAWRLKAIAQAAGAE